MTTTHTVAHHLRRSFRGPVHVPGEADYDAARATWNGAIDPRPAVVAEATGAADVQAALLAARELDLPFAVQATGHGTFVPSDGCVLVKTGGMAEVLVDPDRRIARVGPGARWGQVVAAAAPFGLAPLSGSSPDVGVAGFTLGGGVGWLSRRFGLAADSLLRADIVTADGELVRATPTATASCSGRCAEAAATSASSPRSSCGCSRSARSTPAPRCSRSPAPAPCSSSTATGAPSSPTSSARRSS